MRQSSQGVEPGSAQQGKNQRCHQPALKKAVDGELKNVETDIPAKNRVGGTKRRAIPESKHILPLTAGPATQQQGQKARPGRDTNPHDGPVQDRFFEKHRLAMYKKARPPPVAADQRYGNHQPQDKQTPLGQKADPEDLSQAPGLEPEPIRVEIGEGGENNEKHGNRNNHNPEGPAKGQFRQVRQLRRPGRPTLPTTAHPVWYVFHRLIIAHIPPG